MSKNFITILTFNVLLSFLFSLNSFAIESNENSSKVVCIPDHKYCGYGERKDACEELDPKAKYPKEAIFGISCKSLDCNTDCPVSL